MANEEFGDELIEEPSTAESTPEAPVSDKGDDQVPAPARKSFTEKKGAATRKQSEASVRDEKRTTPVEFVKQSVGELKKVVWPTWAQLTQYFAVVLVFVLFIITYVSLLDIGFGALLLRIFGGGQ